MLGPRKRTLLLEALRPPSGYALDRAVGTSFTLDLLALMTAPLAFTFFDWEDREGRTTADPLALLEAVRRHAGRIALFCQAGRITVPASGRRLLTYLEDSVFEAAAPRAGGLFHPKVWVLRYVCQGEPVRYRLLCLSRNLTFDRAWDTVLVLDGELADRTRAIRANQPLGELVEALPDRAIRPVPGALREAIAEMAWEVRRVRFELPEGFDGYGFWTLGLGDRRPWPFDDQRRSRRMLVVSPFVSDGLLRRIARDRAPGVLISRPEGLAELAPETRAAFETLWVLHPSADPEDEDDTSQPDPEQPAETATGQDAQSAIAFTGLHAKLYVMDDGHHARLWTGSANATDAAFSQNVEFLVELAGSKSFCGVDAILGDEDGKEASLSSLLAPFHEDGQSAPDAEERELEKRLDALAATISRVAFRARATPAEGELYTLDLFAPRKWPPLPEGLRASCRPVTLPPAAALPLKPGGELIGRFGPMAIDVLTRFFAIELQLGSGARERRTRFVVNVPLEGEPPDRRERVLHALLRDPQQVLRLIWLLLEAEELAVQDWEGLGSGNGAWRSSDPGGMPILEKMLKALDRDPTKLDELARLIADLRRTPEGAALLPPGLDAIWEPIWEIREERR